MDDRQLRVVLETIIRSAQGNFDHLSGEAREFARLFNKLSEDVRFLYDALGIEVDTAGNDVEPGSTINVDLPEHTHPQTELDIPDPNPPGWPGEDGEDGLFGPPGRQGIDGEPGIPGPPGFPGEDGDEFVVYPGPTGATGTQGVTGMTGPAGPPGLEGEDGEEGAVYPGPAGPAGVTGPTGMTGPPGNPIPGADGDDGLTFFVPGPTGATGATGETGAAGTSGMPALYDDPDVDPWGMWAPAALGELTSGPIQNFGAYITRLRQGRITFAFDDFVTTPSGVASWADFVSVATGTSAGTSIPATSLVAGHAGLIDFAAGTTATGRCGVHGYGFSPQLRPKHALGECQVDFGVSINVPTLSTSTQRFIVYAGYHGVSAATYAAGLPTNFVGFRYSDNINSGNWQLVTRDGTTATADSGIPVVAGTFYKLEVQVSASAGTAYFFIDEVLVGTISTNIPIGTGAGVSPSCHIEKTVGTTSRSIVLDYIYDLRQFTTER